MINHNSAEKIIFNVKIFAFVLFLFFFDLGIKSFELNGLKINNIDARLILLFIFPIFIFDLFSSKKNVSFSIKIFLFITIIAIHFYFLNYSKNLDLSFKITLKFLFSMLYISLLCFYLPFIQKNINKIIEYFLLLYFCLLILYSGLNYLNGETICIFGCYSLTREIYKEASHFAYISPIILIYYIYVKSIKKLENFKKFLLLFFIISLLQNLSTTLIAAIVIPSFLILLFNFNAIQSKKKLISILIFFLLLIPFHKNTLLKINQFYDVSFLYNDINIKTNSYVNHLYLKIKKPENKEKIEFKEKEKAKAKEKEKAKETLPRKNLSVEVLINNLKIAIVSIKQNFLGWGLHNYQYAHKFYIDKVNTSNVVGSNWLNNTDGSNNFNKGLVEFGIIFFIPLILLFVLLIDRGINVEMKLLVFPILFSQIFIRGSGFFNGGFIFFLIVLLSLYFNKNIKKN